MTFLKISFLFHSQSYQGGGVQVGGAQTGTYVQVIEISGRPIMSCDLFKSQQYSHFAYIM